LEDAIARARALVLPGVVGGRDLHAEPSDRETVADVVTVRRQALLFHQRSHVLRRVVIARYRGKITTSGHAVVVIVAVCDENGVQPRHIGGGDRKLDHHRHVETTQQRIDHHRRATTIDQEPGHAQPPQHGRVCSSERLGTERLGLGSSGLTLHR